MALHEQTQSNTTFLLIKHHSLILESKTPVDGWEAIEVTNPKTNETTTKYIRRFGSVDGRIRRIEWYDTEDKYPTRFMGAKIHLTDNGETFVLDLPYNSRHYDSFTKMMENIDYSRPVEFAVWHNAREDSTAFAIKQDGVPVKWKYTRDNMGDCPEATKNKLGKWNFEPQREWLHERLLNIVIPQVEALNSEEYTDGEDFSGEPVPPPKSKAAPEDQEDIPF